jgi:hypothetical protein
VTSRLSHVAPVQQLFTVLSAARGGLGWALKRSTMADQASRGHCCQADELACLDKCRLLGHTIVVGTGTAAAL